MKKFALFSTIVLLIGILAACSSPSKSLITQDFDQNNYLKSPAEIESIVISQKTQGSLQVLDVRTPEEFQSGCIEGAKNIDFEASNFEEKISNLDKSSNYLIYCRSGRRSALAVSKMKELGFHNIIELRGGINNWIETGESLSKSCN